MDETRGRGSASTPRRQLRGARALGRALEAGEPVRLVLHRPDALSPEARAAIERARSEGARVRSISARQITRLSQAHAAREPAGPELIAMVGPDPGRSLAAVLDEARVVWLLVDTAYPGNAGFVIRTAEVSGADAVVIAAALDHEQRRAVRRAAMRADRAMPVFYADAAGTIAAARAHALRVIGIEDSGDRAPWQADLVRPALFVVGGERHGIPPALLAACDRVLRLPMGGFIPSYNLQAAMAMVAGERLRQLEAAGRSD